VQKQAAAGVNACRQMPVLLLAPASWILDDYVLLLLLLLQGRVFQAVLQGAVS
jgi:hypothetical protein